MAKLGSKKKPAAVHVRSENRARHILDLCEERGWELIVGIEPHQPEDVSDVEKLMRKSPAAPRQDSPARFSRNDYCPCGSGKNYKTCCWDKGHPE